MFKFKDKFGFTVYVKPETITAVEHNLSDTSHRITIFSSASVWDYVPTSEEDCRQFLFDLFKAMGEEYRHE